MSRQPAGNRSRGGGPWPPFPGEYREQGSGGLGPPPEDTRTRQVADSRVGTRGLGVLERTTVTLLKLPTSPSFQRRKTKAGRWVGRSPSLDKGRAGEGLGLTFAGVGRRRVSAKLRRLAAQCQRRGRGEDEEPLAHDQRVLGSFDFVRDLLTDADWERRQALQRRRMSLGDLAAAVLGQTGGSERELCVAGSNGRRPWRRAARSRDWRCWSAATLRPR